MDISFEPPVDPLLVAARLIDNSHNKDGFIADLTPAGPDFAGHMLVGSSPEVLIKRQGSTITAYPLAGSAPRLADPVRDEAQGQNLLASAKNLEEHSYVVNHLRTILEPLCSQFDAPTVPELTKTNEMWHLATPIVGTLKYPHITALELAIRTHPTPRSVAPPPTPPKPSSSKRNPRNFYAGAVGWCDSTGDGEYMVAIRCAEVSEDGTWARAWAGGGIVAESDAQEEFDETTAKLQTIMRSLGL